MTAPARRGPRRPVTVTDEQIAQLVEAAAAAGGKAERARQVMLAASAERAEAVRQLHAGGLSIRQISERLNVSHTVIADMLRRG